MTTEDKTAEKIILKKTMLRASKMGARLIRNNRGQFYDMGSVNKLIGCIKGNNLAAAKEAVKKLRQVRAGLEADGSSDLAGVHTITITPDMVGMRLGIPLLVETKESTWKKPTDEHERKQENFINQAINRGCLAFFLTDDRQLEREIETCFKKLLDNRKQSDKHDA